MLFDREKLLENIDAAAKFDFDNKKVFCSAYRVHCNDGFNVESFYGTADAAGKIPITDKSIFRMASMTKPITALAALILVERGELSLDSLVTDFLPEFKGIRLTSGERVERPLTVKSLLNHTSGIASMYISEATAAKLKDTMPLYVKAGLAFEPGTAQEYSGTGAFNVLARIVEIVVGTEFDEFLRREIFVPCAMTDTTFVPNTEQWGRIVDLHTRENGENAVHKLKPDSVFFDYPCSVYLGGAGLVSTMHDYCNFADMLLHGGIFDGKRIVSEKMCKLMATPSVSQDIMPGNERWGLGVRVITDSAYPTLTVGSFGWSGAYGTHFWIDPANGMYAVFMKNSMIDRGGANESAVIFEKAVYSSIIS